MMNTSGDRRLGIRLLVIHISHAPNALRNQR